MAKINNFWVGYLDRSFDQIFTNLKNRLVISNPELTDHSPSNPLIILMNMFAGVAEMLGFNIDDAARESYIFTARRFSSLYKNTRILDYRIKSYIPALVDLKFELVDEAGNPVNLTGSNFSIPSGLILTDSQGFKWLTLDSTQLTVGNSEADDNVGSEQKVLQSLINLGNTTGLKNSSHLIVGKYANDSLTQLTLGSATFTRQSTLAYSGVGDTHFITEINMDRNAILMFGNSAFGMAPVAGIPIIATYYTTEGAAGNNLDKNETLTLDSALTVPSPGVSWKITAVNKASSGADIEALEDIRINSVLLARANNRAVTPKDFEDISRAYPGVLQSKVSYCCGKCITLYIYPDGGGIASAPLLDNVQNHFNCLKGPNICVNTLPAGQTPFFHKLIITGNYRYTSSEIGTAVDAAMVAFYDPIAQVINANVQMSDIIIALKALNEVESVVIDEFYTRPYARTITSAIELDWDRVTEVGSTGIVRWELHYLGASNFAIIKEGNQIATIAIGAPYTDPMNIITFTINTAAYISGMKWKFTTYNRDRDIALDDYTVPVMELVTDLVKTINVSTTPNDCNTNC